MNFGEIIGGNSLNDKKPTVKIPVLDEREYCEFLVTGNVVFRGVKLKRGEHLLQGDAIVVAHKPFRSIAIVIIKEINNFSGGLVDIEAESVSYLT